jgi:hypothetical protein
VIVLFLDFFVKLFKKLSLGNVWNSQEIKKNTKNFIVKNVTFHVADKKKWSDMNLHQNTYSVTIGNHRKSPKTPDDKK